MITAEDADFHERDPSIRTWAETTVLLFSVPEEGILGNAYVLARPNLGVAISSVIVGQGLCPQTYEIDFVDPQMHLPCPASFTDYQLENGLSVKVTNAPRDYHATYSHSLGNCSFDLNFHGLMHPFDALDPEENPALGNETFQGLGDQWSNGHYEMLGHVTGELELRGRKYKIDSFEGMDHSWGPRAEEGKRAVSWIPIVFGEDFGMHVVMALEIRNGEVIYDAFRFGFVMEDGEVFGLVDAQVQAQRVDMLGVSNHIRATDERGKKFEVFGSAISGHPFHSFNPCSMAYQSLYEYHSGDRVGHGICTDVFGLDFLAERMSRHGRKR